MATKKKAYYRLPGTGYRRVVSSWVIFALFFVVGIFALLFRGRRVQLWQGEDHLLFVEWDGYREYYKRFHYRDIQAITAYRTADGKIVNGVLSVLIVVPGSAALATSNSGLRTFLLILTGIIGLFLLLNWALGPTCRCYIRTLVQIEDLPSLTRLRNHRRTLKRIRPLITAAQGELAPDEIAARMRELAAAPEERSVPQFAEEISPGTPGAMA